MVLVDQSFFDHHDPWLAFFQSSSCLDDDHDDAPSMVSLPLVLSHVEASGLLLHDRKVVDEMMMMDDDAAGGIIILWN